MGRRPRSYQQVKEMVILDHQDQRVEEEVEQEVEEWVLDQIEIVIVEEEE